MRVGGRAAAEGAELVHYVSSPSGGRPLEPWVQRKMEQGFGRSLDGVRIHDDQQAHAASQALGARAFTHGNDIFFGAGQYAPSSAEGMHLLAHEVTHTIQQEGARGLQSRLEVGGHDDPAEAEADRVADEVVRRTESRSSVPEHVTWAIHGGPGFGVQMKRDLDGLRPAAQRLRGVEFGEGPVAIQQRSPLSTIRCMGRAPSGRERALEQMSLSPEEMTREVFSFFYPGLGMPDVSNPRAQELAARMLWEAIQASRRMDLVPRPPGGLPGPGWLVMQAVQIAWRRGRDEGIYKAVKVEVASMFRSAFDWVKTGDDFSIWNPLE
ncbi:MAG: DUF4157 domain-containing protein [Myxococcales bacterium]|nr:DUF4157 domain-containing protein [Myxococcales bacterium]